MRKVLSALACLFCTSLVCSAFGATQLAKFVGFTDDETQGTFTVDLRGMVPNDDGSVTITTNSICLSGSSTWAGTNGVSVVLKYRNLAPTSNAAITTLSLGTSAASSVGCYATSGNVVKGVSSGGAWSSETDTVSTGTIDDSGYVVLTYTYETSNSLLGTYVYDKYGNNLYQGARLRGGGVLGTAICIGGTYAGNMVATNMVVEGAVIYEGILTTADEIITAVLDYDSVSVSGDDSIASISDINTLLNTEGSFSTTDTAQTNKVITFSSDVTITNDATLASAVGIKSASAVHLVADTDNSVDPTATTTAENNDISKLDLTYATGGVYYDYWTSALSARVGGNYYTAGAGSETSGAGVTLNDGGTMVLTNGTYYYAGNTGTNVATTDVVRVTVAQDAIIGIDTTTALANPTNRRFNVGNATYEFTGNSKLTTPRLTTVVGNPSTGCNSTISLSDTASITVTGLESILDDGTDHGVLDDGNANIVFGFLGNGTNTYTQSGNATFTATNSEIVLRGANNVHTLNINGGTMTVRGIRVGGNASGANTLNLAGGTLNLGSSGIYTSSGYTYTIPVSVTADSTIGGTDLENAIPITQTVTVSDGATLTFSNAVESATTDATIDMTSGTLTCNGSLAVLENVNLKVADISMDGAVTGAGTITVSGTASLTGLTSDSPKVALSGDAATLTTTMAASGLVSGEADQTTQTVTVVLTDDERLLDQTFSATDATVIFVDSEGNTLNSTDGTYTVSGNVKTLTLTDGGSTTWSDGPWMLGTVATTAPTASDFAEITGTGTVTISATATAGMLTVSGTGTVTLSGTENLTISSELVVESGATLEYSVSESATANIPLVSGSGTLVKTGAGTLRHLTTSGDQTVAEGTTIQFDEGTFRIGLDDNQGGENPILNNVTLKFVNNTAVFSSYGWVEAVGTIQVEMANNATNGLAAVGTLVQPVMSFNSSDSDATMTVSGSGTFTAPINLPTTVNAGATLAIIPSTYLTTFSKVISGEGAVYVPDSGTVTNIITAANTFTGGMTIDGIVQLGSTSALGATDAISGTGRVIYVSRGQIPTASAAAEATAVTNPMGVTFTNETWTGTVTLYGFTPTAYQNYTLLVNTNSTLDIDSVTGHIQAQTVKAKEIRISKTNNASGNYGLRVNDGGSTTYITFAAKLTGDGPITMSGSSSPTVRLSLAGDTSEWTGTLTTANNYSVLFASTETEKADVSRYITVSTNVSVNVSTWSTGTVAVYPGAVLNVTSNSAVTATSAMTFAEGAQIVASDTTEETPATFTAALTINGATTLSGGVVLATSATGDGTLTLADTDSELILTDVSSTTPTVASGVEGYKVRTKTTDVGYTAYYLIIPGIRVYIR